MSDNHPDTCRMCRGSNYIPGPTIDTGHRTYTTVRPCRHPWWNDNPDNHDRNWLPTNDPNALDAVARGMTQGLADLDAIRNRPQPARRRKDTT